MLARLWSGQKTLGPWGVWTDTGIFAEKKLSGRGFNSDYLHVTALLPFSLTLGGMPLPPPHYGHDPKCGDPESRLASPRALQPEALPRSPAL